MSLLMDALKKAEKDKKKAADETRPEVSVQAPAPSDPGLTTTGRVAGGVAPTELPAQAPSGNYLYNFVRNLRGGLLIRPPDPTGAIV